jgi:endonuclease III
VIVGDAKKFEAWWARAVARHGNATLATAHADGVQPEPVDELVFSMLLWNSTVVQARAAFVHLRRELVDHNELRVCSPMDIVQIVGESYPNALERAIRIRHALGDIFSRHSNVCMPRPVASHDGLSMLLSLQGVPYACAARVASVCWDEPVVAVDDRVMGMLVRARIVKQAAMLDAVGGWVLTHGKPAAARTCSAILQACADAQNGRDSRPEREELQASTEKLAHRSASAKKPRTKKA